MSYEIDFKKMVTQLIKPGDAIVQELTGEKANKLHMAVGLAGEVFELFECLGYDATKKKVDEEHLLEELGDIEFYLEGLNQAYFTPETKNFTSPLGEPQQAVEALHKVHYFAGRVLDLVKKEVIYNKEDTLLAEQIRNALRYLRLALNVFINHRYPSKTTNEALKDIQQANASKLLTGKNARFAEGLFTNAAAQARRDKNGED